MPKLYVHTPFTLRHDDGRLEQFTVGERDIPADTAAHWYVKHHAREPGDAPPPAAASHGDAAASAAIAAARAELDAEAVRIAQQRAELEAFERDLASRAEGLDTREAAIDMRESAADVCEQEHAARVAELDAAQKASADTGAQRGGKRA
ncbi:hypothetical protein C7405_101654 [Paraburkholderia caballeronis]|uniref:STY1053 family phage-associated protein n=1 Tax=Paraburkholderia caballeronis TaxID=416943 RepID=UPI001064FDF2|nr:hypothetical protein [Paraburkholderia caballeronis]TDV39535.1 hypothetical protein C7405_101654 [Paraburkholderia caballeronis]